MKNFYFNKDTKVEVQNGMVTLTNNKTERVNLDFKEYDRIIEDLNKINKTDYLHF